MNNFDIYNLKTLKCVFYIKNIKKLKWALLFINNLKNEYKTLDCVLNIIDAYNEKLLLNRIYTKIKYGMKNLRNKIYIKMKSWIFI